MTQVFISHSSEDAFIAREVAAALQAAGLNIWIAPDSIPPGQAYNEAIVAGIKASDALAILVSNASNASRHVAREVGIADSHGKQIVPIRIEAVEPSDGLAYYLSMPQWVEWHARGAVALSPMIAMLGSAPSLSEAVEPASALQPLPSGATGALAMIEVRRSSHLAGSARSVAVLIDGQKVGEVGNGKAITLQVAAGRHEIAARVDYIKSEPFTIEAFVGRVRVVELSLPNIADVGAQLSGLLGKANYFSWKLLV